MEEPSHVVPEWDREKVRSREIDAGRRLLSAIRTYQKNENAIDPIAMLRRRKAIAEHRVWSRIAGCEIPITTQIDGGFSMPDGRGVQIDDEARIGPNCIVSANVTIARAGDEQGAPVLEGSINVGAGASILGSVRIGHHTEVEPNAVVTTNVPPFSIVAGAPAVVEPRRPPTVDERGPNP